MKGGEKMIKAIVRTIGRIRLEKKLVRICEGRRS